MRLKLSLKKILSVIATSAVIFNSVAPYSIAIAEELSPTPEPTPIETTTPSTEPSTESTVSPTIVPTPTESATPTPDASIAPTEEPTPEATTQVTPAPETTQPDVQETTTENAQSQAPPTETPSVTPTPLVTPVHPDVLKVCAISGASFTQTLLINLLSARKTTQHFHNSDVTTDSNGSFVYLPDGIYRPNYKVEVFWPLFSSLQRHLRIAP
jgi:hypothetical protein